MEDKAPNDSTRNVQMNSNLYQAGVAMLDYLATIYPNCFFPRGYERPLKKGILKDLLESAGDAFDAKSNRILVAALQIYTCALSYRASLIAKDAKRINLQGTEIEPVTEKERLLAKGEKKLRFNWHLSLPEIVELKNLKAEKAKYNTLRKKKENKPVQDYSIKDFKV